MIILAGEPLLVHVTPDPYFLSFAMDEVDSLFSLILQRRPGVRSERDRSREVLVPRVLFI